MTKQIKFISAAEAVKVIKTGDHIHLSSVASAPQCLINAMCDRGRNKEFEHVHVHHLHTEGPAPYAAPEFEGIFQLDSFFVGGNVRKVTQSGYADYIPVFLSETQKLYRSGTLPCDVAMIQAGTTFSKDIPPYIIAGGKPVKYAGPNTIIMEAAELTEKVGKQLPRQKRLFEPWPHL